MVQERWSSLCQNGHCSSGRFVSSDIRFVNPRIDLRQYLALLHLLIEFDERNFRVDRAGGFDRFATAFSARYKPRASATL